MASNKERPPAHNVFNFGPVTFSSNFDNGNLARAEQVPNKSFDFRIWTAPDNMGSTYQSKHCAWYYFMVTGLPQGCVLRLQIVNTSNHSGLYKYDMRPVYRSNATNQKWVRIKSSVRFSKDSSTPQLYFEHGVEVADDKLYFAFTYPYTYSMVQNELDEIVSNHTNNLSEKGSIFFQRELITRSLDGRRIDLLTITSADGASTTETEPLLSGLFPDTKAIAERPPVFPDKEVVFVSARVHPGEVPAQHTFKGIMNLLLDPNDLRAKELRARYVFKLIPMLNPDGVYRGHFRMDQLGQNLNRYYINSDAMLQPAVFAAKSLTDYYATQGKLSVYLDFHAHASKRGCFIYGNVLDSAEDQIQNQLYCKLIALNSAHFDYEGCLFSKEHMTRIDPGDQAKGLTAEGSGRVSMYLAHGIIHSYTIECNYNTSRVGNEIAAPDTDPGGAAVNPPSPFTTTPEKYTPSTFAGVGRACVIALLDIRGHNTCSRISKSKFKTLDRVRNAVMMEVRSRKDYIGKAIDRERRRSLVAIERKSGDFTVGSMDDLCWRRVVEAAAEPAAIPQNAASAKESGSSGRSQDPGDSSAEAFFVSMKDNKEPRRRQRSASAVQLPPKPLPRGGAPSSTAPRAANSSADSSGSNSRSVTPQNLEMAANGLGKGAPSLPPAPTRPGVRTEANSSYLPVNGLTPHLARRTSEQIRPSSSAIHDIMRESPAVRPGSTPAVDIVGHGDARSSTSLLAGQSPPAPVVNPSEWGLTATQLPVLHTSAHRESVLIHHAPHDAATSSGASLGSAAHKGSRNILGKKLHAAGVALVMGNNEIAVAEPLHRVRGGDPAHSIGDSLDALSIARSSPIHPSPPVERPVSSSGGSQRNRELVLSAGIATQPEDQFLYHISTEPRLSPASRDPYAVSPVKSIRSPTSPDTLRQSGHLAK